ncbi:S10 family peptidase [Luteimonas sp. RIT-PG2_3]
MKDLRTWLAAMILLLAGLPSAHASDEIAVARHQGTFNGVALAYTSRVEHNRISDGKTADGKDGPSADVVSIAYMADVVDAAQRPVIFVFNGGPISPSIYLHMGAFGPKRVAFPDDLAADPETFALVDNPYTVLDVADVVLFDPTGTGYSRVADGTAPNAYFSVEADARQLVQMIETWSRRHGRLDSPKYLLGESYGTLRAARAARLMSERVQPLRVDGVFLLGQALNIIEMAQRPGNVTSYVVSLTTLASLGWYHGKVEPRSRRFEDFLDEVRQFAEGDYLTALFQGGNLPDAEKQRIAARLEALTGLPAQVHLAHDLKVTKDQYRVELLRGQGLVLGGYDARYVGTPEAPGQLVDASMAPWRRISDTFDAYARDVLRVPAGLAYVTQSPVDSLEGWDWAPGKSPFADWPYMRDLGIAMDRQPGLSVVVAAGYYDTATTIGASEYAIAQSGWPRDRVRMLYYQGGHMPYTIESSLKQFTDDLRAWMRR